MMQRAESRERTLGSHRTALDGARHGDVAKRREPRVQYLVLLRVASRVEQLKANRQADDPDPLVLCRHGEAPTCSTSLVLSTSRSWAGLERLCEGALSAEDVALQSREATAAAAIWLDAWSDVVRLRDLTGTDSIQKFDDRFPMYQSLFNWSQNLEDALWNGGREDPQILRARVTVCEEALRRFPDEDELMVGTPRRAMAESDFELGETERDMPEPSPGPGGER